MSDTSFTLPGVSSTKARFLHHLDELRFDWLQGRVSTRSPISLEIHLTNACNLRCSFCSYGDVRAQEMLPQAAVRRLVADLCTYAPVLKAVVFSGGGEPTLHPGFAEAVHNLADAGIAIGVITNGVRVTPGILDSFKRCAWVRISLDTPDRQHYRTVLSPHSSTNFDRVLDNVSRLSSARGENSSPVIGLAYLIDHVGQTDENILRCIDIAAQVGADYIHYRPIFGSDDLRMTRSLEDLYQLAPAVDAHARRLGIGHQFGKFLGTYNKAVSLQPRARDASCPIVSDGLIAMIAATGDVLPCYAHVMNARDTAFGNIVDQSFDEIWKGPLRQTVVRAIDAAKTCPSCRYQAGNAMLWNQADQLMERVESTPGYEEHSLQPNMGLQRDDNDPHWMFL